MTGPAVYEAINSQDPELAARVVFLSGGAFSASVHEFLARTSNLRIDKPFTKERILEVASQLVARRRDPAGQRQR